MISSKSASKIDWASSFQYYLNRFLKSRLTYRLIFKFTRSPLSLSFSNSFIWYSCNSFTISLRPILKSVSFIEWSLRIIQVKSPFWEGLTSSIFNYVPNGKSHSFSFGYSDNSLIPINDPISFLKSRSIIILKITEFFSLITSLVLANSNSLAMLKSVVVE